MWEVIVAGVLTVVSGIVWGIRLEGKVSEHDQLFEEREKLYMERKLADKDRHQDLEIRLARIEEKLDTIAYGFIKRPL